MYEEVISRVHRCAILIMVDRSGSMVEKVTFRGMSVSKAEAVAISTNILIDELLHRSRRAEGWRNYFDIAVLGYSGDEVTSLLSDRPEFLPLTDLLLRRVEIERRYVNYTLPSGNIISSISEHRRWITPAAAGRTPMFKAFQRATHLLRGWCRRRDNRDSFPPIVINITDGEATDCDGEMLSAAAAAIKSTGTTDGQTLLINLHLAPTDVISDVERLRFPNPEEPMPKNRHAKLLCDISSTLPERFNEPFAGFKDGNYPPPYKCMCYNCHPEELFELISIGTISLVDF